MSIVLSFLTSSFGRIAVLCLACFLAGAIVCWRWTHREAPTRSDTFQVKTVENGATFAVQAGLLGRQTRLVMIAGVTAPGLNDPLGPESQQNLEKLAGKSIRVETQDRQLGTGTIVGQVFGDTNADLGIAQLQAGLATCETGATKAQLAAQTQAQKAKRGLWASSNAGSHFWHFSLPNQTFPEPVTETQALPKTMDYQFWGNVILFAVAAIVLGWIIVSFAGPWLASQGTVGKAAVGAIDTSAEIAAYGALTAVRRMPGVSADPQAVTACEYLLVAVMKWPAAPAVTPAAAAKS